MNPEPLEYVTGPARPLKKKKWSLGFFGPGRVEPPEACLLHCLDGRSCRAATHGCAMVKHLASKWKGVEAPSPAAGQAPEVCGQGYGVNLVQAKEPGQPDVLFLHAPGDAEQAKTVLGPVMQQVQMLAAENHRLNEENNGLAEEVLRSYEQLNLIFDVSAEIAGLTDADEVRRLLLNKLRYLFAAQDVLLVHQEKHSAIRLREGGLFQRGYVEVPKESLLPDSVRILDDLPQEFFVAREKLKQSQRVTVLESTGGHDIDGRGTSLWGLLVEDEHASWIVGVVRRQRTFVAGDMLVLDSVLSYSGYILSNLRLIERLKQTSFEAVRALVNAIDQKDSYTCGHSERVGYLAKLTGRQMGFSPELQQQLEWAGLLHDVGKIGIPEAVLNKPAPLTPEEYHLIRDHPYRSHEVLKPVAMLEPVLEGVLHHHENPDGTGYPCGLRGDEIPMIARIVHVVDVFDALTSSRSYREAYDVECAIDMLRKDAGTKLDARIVDAFLSAWSLLPQTHPDVYAQWFSESRELPHEAHT
jgi:HD-GYP domain-containing protein (c-di-GMP phosphodiesterase class II)